MSPVVLGLDLLLEPVHRLHVVLSMRRTEIPVEGVVVALARNS